MVEPPLPPKRRQPGLLAVDGSDALLAGRELELAPGRPEEDPDRGCAAGAEVPLAGVRSVAIRPERFAVAPDPLDPLAPLLEDVGPRPRITCGKLPLELLPLVVFPLIRRQPPLDDPDRGVDDDEDADAVSGAVERFARATDPRSVAPRFTAVLERFTPAVPDAREATEPPAACGLVFVAALGPPTAAFRAAELPPALPPPGARADWARVSDGPFWITG